MLKFLHDEGRHDGTNGMTLILHILHQRRHWMANAFLQR